MNAPVHRRFDTPEPVALHVEIPSGQIDVTATATAETTVEVNGRRAEEVDVHLDSRHLRVIAPKRSGLLGRDDSLFVTVALPAGSDLAVRTGSADLGVVGEMARVAVKSGSGDVRLDVLTGSSTVETGSGDVEVEEVRADARIKCGSGDVQVRTTTGELAVSTGSGDVVVGDVAGEVVVKTGSGDVRIVDSRSDVALTTGSGDLQVETARRGRYAAKGASGSVHVGVPTGTPVWTDITTVSGRIHNALEGVGEPAEGADHVELRATTVSGDVVLVPR
jgi:DUF4097 and DUF4098 domain-containing protein YvlB